MDFEQLIDTAEEWCSGTPFELIAAECSDERRLDFYAEPRFSFYVLCPDVNCDTDSFVSIIKPRMSVCMCLEGVKVLRLFFRVSVHGLKRGLGMKNAKDADSTSQLCPEFYRRHRRPPRAPTSERAPTCQHVWSENEDCLPFLQRAQDYISACGRKSLVQVLDEVFSSFRPLLDLPDTDDTETFEQYHTNVEEEQETDHQQLAVSQQ